MPAILKAESISRGVIREAAAWPMSNQTTQCISTSHANSTWRTSPDSREQVFQSRIELVQLLVRQKIAQKNAAYTNGYEIHAIPPPANGAGASRRAPMVQMRVSRAFLNLIMELEEQFSSVEAIPAPGITMTASLLNSSRLCPSKHFYGFISGGEMAAS